MGDQRDLAADALAELDAAIAVRAGDLAVLQRARDILSRGDDYDTSCDAFHPDRPCHGVVQARWCATCGEVFRRCKEHGGVRAAAHALGIHRLERGHEPPRRAAAQDPSRVPDPATLPVGELRAPPVAEPTAERQAGAPRPAPGPTVIRRRRVGEGVDRGGGRDA